MEIKRKIPMKKIFIVLFCACSLLFSCKEPYDQDIETNLKVLVVEGLITDSVGINYVKLSTAVPYDSSSSNSSQRNATVYITDKANTIYYFDEKNAGIYMPRNANFKGIPGNTYILHVTTKDGYTYISTPQTILPTILPTKFYYEFIKKDEIFYDAFGSAEKVTRDYYSLKFNFKSNDNVAPRFRFNTSQCIQYMISKQLNMDTFIDFYCWYVITSSNNLNFTSEKYPVILLEVNNYPVEEFYKNSKIRVPDMDVKTLSYADTLIETNIRNRILRIKQYRINDDAYQYYKGIANQSADEGKIFDPVATQLYGNMKCTTDSSKLILGFFETSSVTTYSFSIGGSSYSTKRMPNLFPQNSEGFTIDSAPVFWINN
jgi:hypothetical protein